MIDDDDNRDSDSAFDSLFQRRDGQSSEESRQEPQPVYEGMPKNIEPEEQQV